MTGLSRRLSYVLRHRPDRAGLVLDDGGWVDVDALLDGLAAHGRPVSRAALEHVVRTDGKQRFTLNPTGTRVRAAQGHSVPVDLGLAPAQPPPVLWHGTPVRNRDAVLAEGLHRGRRHAVHLSPDRQAALAVGRRRGAPLALRVDAAAMVRDGAVFTRADNGVWLVHEVPAPYLQLD